MMCDAERANQAYYKEFSLSRRQQVWEIVDLVFPVVILVAVALVLELKGTLTERPQTVPQWFIKLVYLFFGFVLSATLLLYSERRWRGSRFVITEEGIVKVSSTGARTEGKWADLVRVNVSCTNLYFKDGAVVHVEQFLPYYKPVIKAALEASGPDSPLHRAARRFGGFGPNRDYTVVLCLALVGVIGLAVCFLQELADSCTYKWAIFFGGVLVAAAAVYLILLHKKRSSS